MISCLPGEMTATHVSLRKPSTKEPSIKRPFSMLAIAATILDAMAAILSLFKAKES